MSSDLDPPTRRLDPAGPPPAGSVPPGGSVPPAGSVPPGGPGAPPPGVVPEEAYVHPAIADQLRSLRTMLALVGVLAAAALGVGLWALLTQEEESDAQRGASAASVEALETQIEEVDSRVDDRATKGELARVTDDQAELEQQVSDLESQVEQASRAGGNTDELTQAIEDLQGDVQQLGERVDAVEQQQGEAGGTGDTP
jgi:uncharacterized protein HemX